jgi:hypothetical protein
MKKRGERGEREEREESGPVTLQNTKKYEPFIYLIVYMPVSTVLSP